MEDRGMNIAYLSLDSVGERKRKKHKQSLKGLNMQCEFAKGSTKKKKRGKCKNLNRSEAERGKYVSSRSL